MTRSRTQISNDFDAFTPVESLGASMEPEELITDASLLLAHNLTEVVPEEDVEQMYPGKQWFLAFDGDCESCSMLSRVVEGHTNGLVTGVSLHSPLVASWRRMFMAEDEKWGPTLFHIVGTRVDYWVGARLAARFVRLLGPVDAWRLADKLGTLARSQKSDLAVSRRSALLGASGVAAALAVAFSNASPVNAAVCNCGVTCNLGAASRLAVSGGSNARLCPNINSTVLYVHPGGNCIAFERGTSSGGCVGSPLCNYTWRQDFAGRWVSTAALGSAC